MKAASVGWIWVWGRASVSGRTRFGKGKMESGRSLTRGRKVNPAHLVSVDPWHVKHGTFFEKKKGHILLVTTGSRMFISQRTQPASASRYNYVARREVVSRWLYALVKSTAKDLDHHIGWIGGLWQHQRLRPLVDSQMVVVLVPSALARRRQWRAQTSALWASALVVRTRREYTTTTIRANAPRRLHAT
jgi:hypothetical protein